MSAYLQAAAEVAGQYVKVFHDLGLRTYVEDSGYRGFHVWLFFTEWVPVRFVHVLEDIVDRRVEIVENITTEYFPNKTHVKQGKMGQKLKLPYGVHCKSGRRSCLLDEDFLPVSNPSAFLDDIAAYTITAIKKVIGAHTEQPKENAKKVEVDQDLSVFGDLPENIRAVLAGCNLMRFLAQKSAKTGYLSHFERLSILFVFGHMGDEGKDFVHKVMQYTINYSYNTTQHFVNRIKAKPISCNKLREQYSKVTAEIGCTCNFGRMKDCYPSPVLHALKNSTDETDEVTIPTSRSLSKTKSQEVHDSLNSNQQVLALARKIIDMRKQKRGIDKNIEKTERELARIFDELKIDSMEIDIGLLTRRRIGDGRVEWVIEI